MNWIYNQTHKSQFFMNNYCISRVFCHHEESLPLYLSIGCVLVWQDTLQVRWDHTSLKLIFYVGYKSFFNLQILKNANICFTIFVMLIWCSLQYLMLSSQPYTFGQYFLAARKHTCCSVQEEQTLLWRN